MNWFAKKDPAAEPAQMVREQLGEFPLRIREAMAKVPRHAFLPPDSQDLAYADSALPIGFGQTISQPWIVALMSTQVNVHPHDRILEIGTGSGYQAAVLAQLGAEVYTIEIVQPLAHVAEATLQRLGYQHVHLRTGDGYGGWPEAAPFDGIIITCAPRVVPPPLTAQLKENGRMLIPVGSLGDQDLIIFQKIEGELTELARWPVRFVPMTGKAERSGRFF